MNVINIRSNQLHFILVLNSRTRFIFLHTTSELIDDNDDVKVEDKTSPHEHVFGVLELV